MNRYPLNYRMGHYGVGDTNTPLLAYRKPVFPGETASTEINLFYETDVVDRLKNPAVVSCYLFYVPHRLVWSGWTDFVADPDSGLSVPTATASWEELWEKGAATRTSFLRRGYKLVYNTFFGDETIGQNARAWYDDTSADTYVTMMCQRTSMQLGKAIMSDLDVPADNFTGTVSGTVATIELNELDRRMRARRSNVVQRFTGEKYTDALARFGVKVSDALIAQPEMVGYATETILPTSVPSATATTTVPVGQRWGKYSGTLKLETAGKFFQEHGYLIGVFSVRPVLAVQDMQYPPEAGVTSRDDFVIDSMLQPYKEYDRAIFTSGGEPDPVLMRGWMYTKGQVTVNGSPAGVLQNSQASINDLRYPAPVSSFSMTYSIQGVSKGATPINMTPRA